jgi:type VI secretion system protein ImpI
MQLKLAIKSGLDAAESGIREQCFDQDTITIGRATVNDVCLPDTKRLISSRHAQIRRAGHNFVLIDIESTNGTILNEQRLMPGRDHPLHQGDRIRIGHFTIHVETVPVILDVPASIKHREAVPHHKEPISRNKTRPVQELLYQLNRLYAESVRESAAHERGDQLVSVLHEAMRGLNPTEASNLLDDVECQLRAGGQASTGPRITTGSQKSSTPVRSSFSGAEVAYDGLLSLARKYCVGWDDLVSADLIGPLLERIDLVLGVTVNSLSDAIKGRREFAREFEVEATRLLSWMPNRIKLAESGQEIGAYLLDPRKEDVDMERIAGDLQGLFHDLALHQLGLVAGFKECLRGLLAELDPQSFEAETRGAAFGIGPLRIPMHLSSLEKDAWTRFKLKHAQLSEEEVKVFERILAPHFAKGYMSVQKAKSHH